MVSVGCDFPERILDLLKRSLGLQLQFCLLPATAEVCAVEAYDPLEHEIPLVLDMFELAFQFFHLFLEGIEVLNLSA
jgi:hypothetical protein